MPVVIRSARPADAPVIAEFNCRLARESEGTELEPPVVAEGVAALLADPGKGNYFVACDGEEILGQLAITFEWSDWRNGWFWWIQSVYILPKYRGKSIYSQLYDFVKRQASMQGNVCGFRLYVEKENEHAQAVYKKLGMEETYYLMFEEII